MSSLQRFLKAFFLLLFCTAFISATSIGGVKAVDVFFPEKVIYPDQTMIGPIFIGGLTEVEANAKLLEEIEKWKKNTTYNFVYFDEKIEFPATTIEFFIPESLKLTSNGFGELLTNVSQQDIINVIDQFTYDELVKGAAIEAIQQTIQKHASTLEVNQLTIDLNENVTSELKQNVETIATVQIEPIETSQLLSDWVSKLDGHIIEGNTVFSLLATMENKKLVVTEGASLNILATALYQLFLQTNFEIKERHIGLVLPPYAKLGFEAVAKPTKNDLKVENRNYYSYKLLLGLDGTKLTVSLVGTSFPYSYVVLTKNEQVIQPKKIVHFSETRRIGDKQVVRNGEEGFYIETFRQVKDKKTNTLVGEHFLFEDFYPPVHLVEEWSLGEKPKEVVEADEGPTFNGDDGNFNELPVTNTPPSQNIELNLPEEVPPSSEQEDGLNIENEQIPQAPVVPNRGY